jgi:hypothetical protein
MFLSVWKNIIVRPVIYKNLLSRQTQNSNKRAGKSGKGANLTLFCEGPDCAIWAKKCEVGFWLRRARLRLGSGHLFLLLLLVVKRSKKSSVQIRMWNNEGYSGFDKVGFDRLNHRAIRALSLSKGHHEGSPASINNGLSRDKNIIFFNTVLNLLIK